MFRKMVYQAVMLASFIISFSGCLGGNEENAPESGSGQVYFKVKDTSGVFQKLNVVNAEVVFKAVAGEPITMPLTVTDSSAEGLVTGLDSGNQYIFDITLSDSLGEIIFQAPQSDTIVKDKSTHVLILMDENYLKGKFPAVFSEPPVQLLALRITNEIPGWKDIPSAFAAYDYEALLALINGGADYYRDLGMVKGIYQEMESTGDNYYQVYVMDFGSPAKALSGFEQSKAQAGGKLPVSGFPESRAIAKTVIGGVTIYAHFESYFFEFNLTGYGETARAISDGVLFLNFYQEKL